MLPHVRLQCLSRHHGLLKVRLLIPRCIGLPPVVGHLLWLLCWTHWVCRIRRNFDASPQSPDHFVQLGLLRSRIVSNQIMYTSFVMLILVSVVFQWAISYMISPDAGNMGIKAVYVWAGMLIPTTIILYFFYPEVCCPKYDVLTFILTQHRPWAALTGRSTSSTNVKCLLGSSRILPPCPISLDRRALAALPLSRVRAIDHLASHRDRSMDSR